MKAITLDVGGTAIKSAFFEGNELLYSNVRPSQAKQGAEILLHNIYSILDEALISNSFEAIGISTTGQVDSDQGKIIYANAAIPNYIGTPLKEILEYKYHVPVFVENDVNAAALGESSYGAGQNEKDFLCLTYGTGVGGAIILNHKLYKGHNQIAAEFGHIITHPNGWLCDCGTHGCYQQYASTTALVKSAKELNPTLVNGKKIFEAFHQGDPDAAHVINTWISEISYGLFSLIYIFNPTCIILGGGILAQTYIVDELRRILDESLIISFRDVRLIPAALGNLAGVYGMKSVIESNLE